MAEGAHLQPPAPEEPTPHAPPPPPLASIRVKAPRAIGLNKPAILIAACGGVGLVLILASGALAPDASRRPAAARPMMSEPARPEMAQTAARRLPATYAEAVQAETNRLPAQTPVLGPPMAGDIAAFAPRNDGYPAREVSWSSTSDMTSPTVSQPDPIQQEALQADRSSIMFDINDLQPSQTSGAAQEAQTQQPTNPLTALRQPTDDRPAQLTHPGDRSLHPGTVIPASLITAINSEAPGPVIAQVTQAIYDSATGKTELIPQGARLIGDYRSSSRYGQGRVAIIWSRLVMPNGEQISLDEAAVDPSGAAGIKGDVDNHWLDVFGAAALGTLINVGVATTEDRPTLTYSGVGIASNYDPVSEALHDGVQRTGSIVTNRIVDRSLTIPPTIAVAAGTRIYVLTTRRLGF